MRGRGDLRRGGLKPDQGRLAGRRRFVRMRRGRLPRIRHPFLFLALLRHPLVLAVVIVVVVVVVLVRNSRR